VSFDFHRLFCSYFVYLLTDRHTLFSAKKTQKTSVENRYIDKIKSEDGRVFTDVGDILKELSSQYEKLFVSRGCNAEASRIFLSNDDGKTLISDPNNAILDRPFEDYEIEEAIHGLKKNKSPGFNGISAEFHPQFQPLFVKIFQR